MYKVVHFVCENRMKTKDDLDLLLVLNIYKDNIIVKSNMLKKFEPLCVEISNDNIASNSSRTQSDNIVDNSFGTQSEINTICCLVYPLWRMLEVVRVEVGMCL